MDYHLGRLDSGQSLNEEKAEGEMRRAEGANAECEMSNPLRQRQIFRPFRNSHSRICAFRISHSRLPPSAHFGFRAFRPSPFACGDN
jgi:hypothetical protein